MSNAIDVQNLPPLPPTWRWTTMSQACLKIQDGTHFSPKNQHAYGKYRYITAKNVKPNGLDLSDVSYLSEADHRAIYKRCDPQKDDVLLVKDGVNTGDAALNTLNQEFSLLSSVCLLRPKSELISSSFLCYFLLSPVGYRLLTGQMTGTAIKRIVLRRIKDSPVPIAPLSEQKSIVAEIEKQFSRLDEAVASLKRTKANLKRYKAAVLKAAVEGKLTKEWRLSARAASRKRAQASELETIPKAGPDKWFVYIIECDDGSFYVGHTADLHARWQAHCDGNGADWTRQHPPKYLVHFEECGSREDAVKREKDLKTGFGRTWRKREIDAGRMKPLVHNPANETAQPVHDEDMQTGSKLLEHILAERRAKWKGIGKYTEPESPDTSDLPTLPEKWAWTVVDQLGVVQLGRQRSPKNRSKDYPVKYIRAANITESGLDLSDLLDMEFSPREQERYRLRGGDLVLSEASGSPNQVGKPAVWQDQLPMCCFQNTVIRLRPSLDLSSYLLTCFKSYYVNGVFAKVASGVGINHLSADKFSKVTVPLPPIAEQQQIVAEVERRLSVIDELESTVETNLTRADRLRQSVLTTAFSGRLTVGEP